MISLRVRGRWLPIDIVRGMAVILMVCYHFSFDLNYFGIIHQAFNYSVFWLTLRALIVTCFLVVVGISLELAADAGNRHYWIRIGKLVAAALAVTGGSYLMFPQSYIYFGILHLIAAASLIARLFLPFYRFNLLLGCVIVALGIGYSNPLFDQPWLQWIGLMTYKPVTEDYVPLFPWLGVVFIGLFLGKTLLRMRAKRTLPATRQNKQILAPSAEALTIPAWMGQHSLAIYLLHQPVLLGLLYLLFRR
ncbi:MAG TPA: heparan-alpha-glucosaminide N-acetyltransferase [Burkholderiales bacterium]|nr:heparan-alpha-glucosaminide N-acetyltransferase [Burkholderiales bacterium]